AADSSVHSVYLSITSLCATSLKRMPISHCLWATGKSSRCVPREVLIFKPTAFHLPSRGWGVKSLYSCLHHYHTVTSIYITSKTGMLTGHKALPLHHSRQVYQKG